MSTAHLSLRVPIASSHLLLPPPPSSTLFPYTTLFRSRQPAVGRQRLLDREPGELVPERDARRNRPEHPGREALVQRRSEEHTSELQSHSDLVCRLLLEKKKTIITTRSRQLNNISSDCR